MGGGSAKEQKSTSTTTPNLPAFVNDASKDFISRAQAQSRVPYEAYTGERNAAFNADENAAFDLSRNSAGDWVPTWQQSQQLATRGGQSWTDPGVAQSYMDPYQKGVTDISARELVKAGDVAQLGRNQNYASEGAWGGAQAGIQNAEAQAKQQQALADLYQTGGSQAWQQGLSAFNQDRSGALAASGQLGNLAQSRQALTQADIDKLLTTGGIQQAQTQQGLDTAYQNWQQKQEYPWQQLQKGAGIFQNATLPYGSTTTTIGGGSSQSGQMAGAGIGAAATVAAAVISS